jgi:transposase
MKLVLTAAERAGLRAAMKRAVSVRLYRRLQAVLLAGDGATVARIAALTGASPRSVQYWCASWRRSDQRRHPQKALEEKPRLGRQPGLPELNRARLLAEMAKNPLALGYAATHWTVPLLARHLQERLKLPISARTLRRRLRAAGLRWKRPRFVFAEPEAHLAQKKGRSCAR